MEAISVQNYEIIYIFLNRSAHKQVELTDLFTLKHWIVNKQIQNHYIYWIYTESIFIISKML